MTFRELWKENPIPLNEETKTFEEKIKELDVTFNQLNDDLNTYENNRTDHRN